MDGHEAHRVVLFHSGQIHFDVICDQPLDVRNELLKTAECAEFKLPRVFVQAQKVTGFGKRRGQAPADREDRIHEDLTDQTVYGQRKREGAVGVEVFGEAEALFRDLALRECLGIGKEGVIQGQRFVGCLSDTDKVPVRH